MKKFGDNKIMRIFAVHFLSSRQRLMDAEAEFLGFKAAGMPGASRTSIRKPYRKRKVIFFHLRLIFR